MQRYAFKEESIFKGKSAADPQKVGEIIASLQRSRTREEEIRTAMWKAAQGNPSHPLYPCYEWNVQTAAEAHWDSQSRSIMNAVRIVDDTKPERDFVKAFHSISVPGIGRRVYTTKEVVRSADLQINLLRQAERELLAFERRYEDLIDICDLIRRARSKVSERLASIHPAEPVA
jgi:hypothetical protein